MKYFLGYCITVIVLMTFILEVVTRSLELSSDFIPEELVVGKILYKPGARGTHVKGGLREIASKYIINNQGYNSTIDYTTTDTATTYIALIGDSYIEGLHVDVENSIGRLVEKKFKDNYSVQVHEYGKSGGNAHDFISIANSLVKDKYSLIFVLITDKDPGSFPKFYECDI